MDKEVIQSLDGIFDDTIREICSNFFRPYNEQYNFICISTLDSKCTINEIDGFNELSDLNASLFVETQLDGLDIDSQDDKLNFVKRLIPDLISKKGDSPIDIMTVVGNLGTPFLTTGNVQVFFREPEVIGFYTETLLFDPEDYKTKVRELADYINNFSVEYSNQSKKIMGKKNSMYLTFLYDYQKQFLFDKRGVLNSNAAKELCQLDDSSRYVQDWLKNSDSGSII